jgi:XRE family aerobic/anaerobic benzoate catabolism transcriptional regulator
MSPTPKQMGRRLKRLRETQGLSQYALARKAKVSRDYLRTLEQGESDPTVGMLRKLAKALGVPVTALLE